MANWGQPDFDARSPEQLAIDEEAPKLRAQLYGEGFMAEWPHNDQVKAGYPPQDVQRYCVKDQEWQGIRLAMKGQPTHKKLDILKMYWDRKRLPIESTSNYPIEVQVGNYLGALRRGGQLDDQNRVRKYI